MEAYTGALKKRKLRPRTIANRLSRLNQFYAYCQANAVDPHCEAGFNPVAGVPRPERVDLETARYLTRSEEASRPQMAFLLDKNRISVKLDLAGKGETDKIIYAGLRFRRSTRPQKHRLSASELLRPELLVKKGGEGS